MGKPPHYSYRSCSAMESNAIKLPVHWALELCNYWVHREFFAFMQSTRPHSAITLSDTLWMSYCGSLKNKQTKQFHHELSKKEEISLTDFCSGGIPLQ